MEDVSTRRSLFFLYSPSLEFNTRKICLHLTSALSIVRVTPSFNHRSSKILGHQLGNEGEQAFFSTLKQLSKDRQAALGAKHGK